MNNFQSNILQDSHIFHEKNATLFDIFSRISKFCRCLRVKDHIISYIHLYPSSICTHVPPFRHVSGRHSSSLSGYTRAAHSHSADTYAVMPTIDVPLVLTSSGSDVTVSELEQPADSHFSCRHSSMGTMRIRTPRVSSNCKCRVGFILTH